MEQEKQRNNATDPVISRGYPTKQTGKFSRSILPKDQCTRINFYLENETVSELRAVSKAKKITLDEVIRCIIWDKLSEARG